jgi:hypothetical protein
MAGGGEISKKSGPGLFPGPHATRWSDADDFLIAPETWVKAAQ